MQLIVRFLPSQEQPLLREIDRAWNSALHSHYELWTSYRLQPRLVEEELPFTISMGDTLATDLDHGDTCFILRDESVDDWDKTRVIRWSKPGRTYTHHPIPLEIIIHDSVLQVALSSYGLHFIHDGDCSFFSSFDYTNLTSLEEGSFDYTGMTSLEEGCTTTIHTGRALLLPQLQTSMAAHFDLECIAAHPALPFVYAIYTAKKATTLLQCHYRSDGHWEEQTIPLPKSSALLLLFVQSHYVLVLTSASFRETFTLSVIQHDNLSRVSRTYKWADIFRILYKP
jgi:hypothetical protein